MSFNNMINDKVGIVIVVALITVPLISNGLISSNTADFIISFAVERLFSPIGLIFYAIFGVSLFKVSVTVLKKLYEVI